MGLPVEIETGELRVYYKANEKIDRDMDETIEMSLKSFGYIRWASGYNFETGVRDLAFERSAVKNVG